MEEGVKEEPVQQKETKFLSKTGWVKKAHGRLLTSYKERYVQVEKTEVVVYENEDLQNCLERLDLENYDMCHELKSPFKKKHRLVLIRSPKSGNKVHDVKFQTQTAEEKEAWIRALSEAVSRAKNKVFDEVKVDESSNLEHVTRTRPKGNQNRRPPTRIHLKEVAEVSSDGVLRLDLDLEDAVMPNGTHHANTDETPKEAQSLTPDTNKAEEPAAEEKAEPEAKKKVIKPPVPPTKETKPSSAPEDKPDEDPGPEKKKPPMPPSNEATLCVQEAPEDPKTGAKKKTGPPPTPPNKPSSSSSLSNLTEVSPSTVHRPAPPSKEKKPTRSTEEPNQQVHDTPEEEEEKPGTAVDNKDAQKAPLHVGDGEPERTTAEGAAPEDSNTKSSDSDQLTPPLTSEETSEKYLQHQEEPNEALDTSGSSPPTPEVPLQRQVPSIAVSQSDSLSLSSLLSDLPGGTKKAAEEKSVDSGQHSDDESEGSGSDDMLAASTAALQGSHAGLDVLEAAEDHIQMSVNLRPTAELQVRSVPCRRSEPTQKPPKPSSKPRSVSIGDLLLESSGCPQLEQTSRAAGRGAPDPQVIKLETEVALEIEKTGELLSQVQGGPGEGVPEDLLVKALDKLKKADHVLKEVQKLKLTNSSSSRMSW